MRHAVELVGILNLVLFAAIAGVCLRQWRRERATSALWATLAFVTLAWVIVAGRVLPQDPEDLAGKVIQRLDLVILVMFPYLLYRFATAFERSRRPLARVVDSLSVVLVAGTMLLPSVPSEGESWRWWFVLYVIGFLIHWSLLLSIVAIRLWRAGREEASVARRRMQMLAFASTALTAALVFSLAASDEDSLGALGVALLGTFSGFAFLLGFAPPVGLRLLWRRPEQARMQQAIGSLMAATSEQDVAARVLPPMASMVGARGIRLESSDGTPIGAHGSIDEGYGDIAQWEFPFGRLVVRTSTFAPFFGDEERKLLTALGSLTGLALDRARLFAREREARASLQRADELKNQFVALAAHELRSPVGAIYGLSETIAARSGELASEQLEELQSSLTVQIRRLRELVEQLLDLSRLDAEAVVIRPQLVRVRDRLEAIVGSVSPFETVQIGIEVDPSLEAELDVDALDRIVSNLILNACRYGEPPVLVSAATERGSLRVTVQDSGPGVPAEFVPQLFDRFARGSSGGSSPGTGLGLAIARSYARAHSGEISYRPAKPRGAAFELVLPAPAAA
ncbi:MAG TPA: ATP-binding protein [Gaiellaceae bacterium]|nr:ATP-binding protein [Gaiellaceae bacterium]